MREEIRLGIAMMAMVCALMAFSLPAAGAVFTVWADGNWNDPATFQEGATPGLNPVDFVFMSAVSSNTTITDSYALCGFFGPGWGDTSSTLTIQSGGSLDVTNCGPDFFTNAQMACGAGGGKLVIEDGGTFHLHDGYYLWVGAPYSTSVPGGTGIVEVQGGGSFTVDGGCVLALGYGSDLGLPVDEQQHGVLKVVGGGSTIYVWKPWFGQGSELMACPTANGAAGLSTVEADYVICNTWNPLDETDNTITVAPQYQVQEGDQWVLLHHNYERFNDFDTLQTIPADLGVSKSWGDDGHHLTITVTSVPAAPVQPDLTVTDSNGVFSLAWSSTGEELGWIVQRSEEGGPFVDIASLDGDASGYEDTDVDALVSYQYQIVAVGVGGNTTSEPVSATTSTVPAMSLVGLAVLAGALSALGFAKKH